jgi:hypothetical protein
MNTTLVTAVLVGFIALTLSITTYNKQQMESDIALAKAGLEQCKSVPDFISHAGVIWVKDCKTYIKTIRNK